MKIYILAFLTFISMSSNLAFAFEEKLALPRFATIKSSEVNARSGPSVKTPIQFVFVKKGEPVEIVAEYEQWRQIKDIYGEGGWVHVSVLSGKRSVIVKSKNTIDLKTKPAENSKILAKVTQDVRCKLSKCEADWCKVTCQNHEGWLARNALWGVYPGDKY